MLCALWAGWLVPALAVCVCVLRLCRRVDVVMLRMPKLKASTAAALRCHESAVLDEAKIRLLPVLVLLADGLEVEVPLYW